MEQMEFYFFMDVWNLLGVCFEFSLKSKLNMTAHFMRGFCFETESLTGHSTTLCDCIYEAINPLKYPERLAVHTLIFPTGLCPPYSYADRYFEARPHVNFEWLRFAFVLGN